jgi:hypothetical protein
MKEFEITVTRIVHYTAKVKVTAENADDAEDLVVDEFYADDGAEDGIRSKLEFDGHTVEFAVNATKA